MYVGGTVLESGHYASLRGMEQAADKIAQAAVDISDAAMQSAERVDAVQGAEAAESSGFGPAVVKSFDQPMMELSMGDHSYRANLHSARASDAQFEQLLDMAIPQGYSRLVEDSAV